jgi:hypothetical protein
MVNRSSSSLARNPRRFLCLECLEDRNLLSSGALQASLRIPALLPLVSITRGLTDTLQVRDVIEKGTSAAVSLAEAAANGHADINDLSTVANVRLGMHPSFKGPAAVLAFSTRTDFTASIGSGSQPGGGASLQMGDVNLGLGIDGGLKVEPGIIPTSHVFGHVGDENAIRVVAAAVSPPAGRQGQLGTAASREGELVPPPAPLTANRLGAGETQSPPLNQSSPPGLLSAQGTDLVVGQQPAAGFGQVAFPQNLEAERVAPPARFTAERLSAGESYQRHLHEPAPLAVWSVQGTDLVAGQGPFDVGMLDRLLHQLFEDVGNVADDVAGLLARLGLDPWIVLALAAASVAGEVARRNLRRSQEGPRTREPRCFSTEMLP